MHLIVLKIQKENKNIAIWMIERLMVFFVHLIGLKIQNHKFEIAFSSDSEGLNWSVVDLVNVVVDLVTVVAFFAVVADVVDILFSSDSG